MDQSPEEPNPGRQKLGSDPQSLSYATADSAEKRTSRLESIVGSVLSLISLGSLCLMGMFLARSHGGREWDGLGETVCGILCFIGFALTAPVGILFLVIGSMKKQRLAFITLPVFVVLFIITLNVVPLPFK